MSVSRDTDVIECSDHDECADDELSRRESFDPRIAAKRRQVIAWGASPRMAVNRHVEPRSGGRCDGEIGNV
jgi:hypothetical protein